MKLTKEQLKSLTYLLDITRSSEINCNEYLDQVAEYAEANLANKPLTKELEEVKHHLSFCLECREEYEALVDSLKSIGEDE